MLLSTVNTELPKVAERVEKPDLTHTKTGANLSVATS